MAETGQITAVMVGGEKKNLNRVTRPGREREVFMLDESQASAVEIINQVGLSVTEVKKGVECGQWITVQI